ncbi:MAG: class I SAM-dependent methyltransferase [Phycisphaerae bacterium]|nr:class I SAM-dependent methyltransferase [Phycisphaerae bacterium]
MAKRVAVDRPNRAASRRGVKHAQRRQDHAGRSRSLIPERSGAASGAGDGLYQDPLIYDILHEPGTPLEVRSLATIWRRVAEGSPRTVLEPACGTGRYLERFADAGWKCLGFDIDPAMVRFASARLPQDGSRVWRGRLDNFGSRVGPGSVGLAFCPINSIRHVESDGEMVRHLKAIRRVLAPSGVYAVGISLSAYGLEAPTEDVWSGKRGSVHVKQVVSYTPATGGRSGRGERVDSVLEIRRGRRIQVRSSTYSLFSYSRAQWERVIARSGLRAIGMVNEYASGFDPGRIGYAIWLLARPDHPLAFKRSVRGSRRSG